MTRINAPRRNAARGAATRHFWKPAAVPHHCLKPYSARTHPRAPPARGWLRLGGSAAQAAGPPLCLGEVPRWENRDAIRGMSLLLGNARHQHHCGNRALVLHPVSRGVIGGEGVSGSVFLGDVAAVLDDLA